MRRTAQHAQVHGSWVPARGWAIVGAALASWLLVAGLWAVASQLFHFVLGAI